jgi:NMD protein affecting ribosome stability and mRNA decay
MAELADNERAISVLICPRCGLSMRPRAGWLVVE